MKQDSTTGSSSQLPSSSRRCSWRRDGLLPSLVASCLMFCLSLCLFSPCVGYGALRMLSGGIVSCSSKDSTSGVSDKSHAGKRSDGEGVVSCNAPLVRGVWMRSESRRSVVLDENSNQIETLPHVEIRAPVLDWGTNTLYSPSLVFLNVANAYNDSVLHVYDLFSTDLQFYAYDFGDLSLLPGDSATISIVFLPRWLGLSSAHLVMQTNIGGFVIHAKGAAIDSPYRVEPLVDLGMSFDGSLNRTFSLYNPPDNVVYIEEVPEGSNIGLMLQQEKKRSKNTRTGSFGSNVEERMFIKPKLIEVVKQDELIQNWRSQGTVSEVALLEDHVVMFPVVQMGNHFSKWATVPMKATLPVYGLNLCMMSFFHNMLWNLSVPVLTAVSIAFLVFVHIIHRAAKPSCLHGTPKKSDSISSLPSSATKPVELLENKNKLESPHSPDLTAQIARVRGRRRKRKANGRNLSAKFEVSSSQIGNSTPSSPLSPNVLATEAKTSEAEKQFGSTWLMSPQDNVTLKLTGGATLLPSPIAPHARAPGSKLIEDKTIKRDESNVLVKEFTYDIWGSNFSDHFLGRAKEITTKVFDASEGYSPSFFASEPWFFMMMSSARSVTPGRKLPSYDVKSLYQMD